MDRSIYSEKYQALRKWLKAERQKQEGLTLRVLAARLGIHHSIVGKIEQGERKLDVMEFVEYCEALGVDPVAGIRVIVSGAPKRSK
jgi:transcriptional regulator with XRE-family HTH domain